MMLPLFRPLIGAGAKRSITIVSTHRFIFVRLLAVVALAVFASGATALAHPSIDIVAANWHFTPSTITVEAGQPTTLRLTSTSGTHGIASNELGLAATTIGPGRFVEVTFTPHSAGTFKVQCSIFCGAGHPDMVLTVIVTGAAAATSAPATPAPAATAPPPASTPAALTPKPAPTPKPLIDDRHYIIVMVAHGQIAVQALQLAMKIGHHPELRASAKTFAARNSGAIAQLKKWYAAWYGSAVPSVPSSMSVASLARAPDFDRALIVASIQHDAEDATLSLGAEQGLTHPELRAFARSSAAAELGFIQTAWHWYSSWYPEK